MYTESTVHHRRTTRNRRRKSRDREAMEAVKSEERLKGKLRKRFLSLTLGSG
jgi:hypothetical protein